MPKRSTRHFSIALTALPLILGALDASATPAPPFLTHQGRLFTSSGDPVSGEVTFVFSLYASPDGAGDGGAPIWTETHKLTLEQGYFSTVLGESTPIMVGNDIVKLV